MEAVRRRNGGEPSLEAKSQLNAVSMEWDRGGLRHGAFCGRCGKEPLMTDIADDMIFVLR